ncbi:pantetheine-phosphate adenylyltransferase [Nonlabens ponticola]|uniref:Phosphopantetheine adenylyltransferase n=1 Tax=Nonlabens ponticola TaxID=2496866 RepID=A0A3S9N0W5_9FLAO|nr:pantetheine-phosphate adenylyltransferase [Nonlabens ponticola]AZQ45024.1 pantetheine-phosphate adenylyltransferase [Nonlabens ponticola]
MKKAVFPGSFDPLTLGHQDIIDRGLRVFDHIIIAVGINADKKYMFDLDQRVSFIEELYKNKKNISVKTYDGLTVDFCKKENAQFILRGLRNPNDFEFEKAIAQANAQLSDIETTFLLTNPSTSFISSSIVRDVIRNHGDYKKFVPHTVVL